ncbi:MAG: glycosyltransferase [Candidatus Saccharibacteria bacterium]|nr:glycosyltransferase [Candidatus Saccharibacteria bacterium]
MPVASGKKVSVIIPVFNTGELAIKLILKIIKSDYKNLEFILIDDGSTDDSLSLLKEFKRQYDLTAKKIKAAPKLIILHQDNAGASAARNAGLAKASGDYVCFIDSDDSVEKNYIRSLVEKLEQYDSYNSTELRIALATSAVRYQRKKSVRELYIKEPEPANPDEDFTEYILRLLASDGRLHAVNTKIFRRNIIEHFSIQFDEKINFAEDLKFVLEYLKAAHRVQYSRLAFVTEPLYIYNYGTDTSVVSLSSLSWGNWQKSFDHLCKWAGKKPSKKSNKLIHKIRFHWKISHAFAVARSNQSLGHKFQHASPLLVLPSLIIVKFRK